VASVLHSCNVKTQICVTHPQCVKGVLGKEEAAGATTMFLQRKDEHCKNTNMFLGGSQLFADFYFL